MFKGISHPSPCLTMAPHPARSQAECVSCWLCYRNIIPLFFFFFFFPKSSKLTKQLAWKDAPGARTAVLDHPALPAGKSCWSSPSSARAGIFQPHFGGRELPPKPMDVLDPLGDAKPPAWCCSRNTEQEPTNEGATCHPPSSTGRVFARTSDASTAVVWISLCLWAAASRLALIAFLITIVTLPPCLTGSTESHACLRGWITRVFGVFFQPRLFISRHYLPSQPDLIFLFQLAKNLLTVEREKSLPHTRGDGEVGPEQPVGATSRPQRELGKQQLGHHFFLPAARQSLAVGT